MILDVLDQLEKLLAPFLKENGGKLETLKQLSDTEFRDRTVPMDFPALLLSAQGLDRRLDTISNARTDVYRVKLRFVTSSSYENQSTYDKDSGVWALWEPIDDYLHKNPSLKDSEKKTPITGMYEDSQIREVGFVDMVSKTLVAAGLESYYNFYKQFIPYASPRQGVRELPKEVLINGK